MNLDWGREVEFEGLHTMSCHATPETLIEYWRWGRNFEIIIVRRARP